MQNSKILEILDKGQTEEFKSLLQTVRTDQSLFRMIWGIGIVLPIHTDGELEDYDIIEVKGE